MIESRGFLPLGKKYDNGKAWSSQNTTTSKLPLETETDDLQELYSCYAQLKPADGLVYYTTSGGHVVMCSSKAEIDYEEDGKTIDGDNSYITIIDQAQIWKEVTDVDDVIYQAKYSLDSKYTFKRLYESGYVPFTFAELTGAKSIEETTCVFKYAEIEDSTITDGSSITLEQLFNTEVVSNYGIADVYVIVKDGNNEIYTHAVRSSSAGRKVRTILESGAAVDTWGTLPTSGEYNVSIEAQLATGERPEVFSGTLNIE